MVTGIEFTKQATRNDQEENQHVQQWIPQIDHHQITIHLQQMKSILLAVALLVVPTAQAKAYNLNCTYDIFGEVESCSGYDSGLGNYTATPTYTGGWKVQTGGGKTYSCTSYGHCEKWY